MKPSAPVSAVNSQIIDAVRLAQQFTIDPAADQSTAALELAMAHSLGLAMFNAVSAQQRGQMQREAATHTVCAQLLSLAPASTAGARPAPLPAAPKPSRTRKPAPPPVAKS
jgi:hypothetical protein